MAGSVVLACGGGAQRSSLGVVVTAQTSETRGADAIRMIVPQDTCPSISTQISLARVLV